MSFITHGVFMKSLLLLAVLCLTLPFLPGCPEPQRGDHGTTLAVPLDQQIAELNARSLLVQTLKASGRLSLEWRDKDGNHRQTADAKLVLQRLPLTPGNSPANPEALVALFGSFSGTEVFDMAVNQTHHWIAFRSDDKKAYVGKVVPPTTTAATKSVASESLAAEVAPFRADRVLEAMGLALIPYDPKLPGSVQQTPTDDSQNPSTVLTVCRVIRNGGFVHYAKQREIIIGRHTGRIEVIRTYNSNGSLEAVARLTEYFQIKTGQSLPNGDDQKVWVAHRIQVDYPGRQANVDLAMRVIKLGVEIPAKAFEMPDFAEEGLRVVDVDKAK